jgi:hypothetical protein
MVMSDAREQAWDLVVMQGTGEGGGNGKWVCVLG